MMRPKVSTIMSWPTWTARAATLPSVQESGRRIGALSSLHYTAIRTACWPAAFAARLAASGTVRAVVVVY